MEIIRFKNVTFNSEKHGSLIDISFSLNDGEKIIIFGPENSGIDLICPLIAGLERIFEGEIYYRGEIINNFGYLEILNYRKKLGYLQRGYGLINNMSAEENISLPLKYHSEMSSKGIEDHVNTLIKEMNLEYCRKRRPVNLTKSETLRTAYLRSIILNPDLLMIEQAIEEQSFINSQTFINSLRKTTCQENKSALFITYLPDRFSDLADRFIMFYNGKIVFSGTKEEYFTTKNEYVIQYKNSSLEGPMNII